MRLRLTKRLKHIERSNQLSLETMMSMAKQESEYSEDVEQR